MRNNFDFVDSEFQSKVHQDFIATSIRRGEPVAAAIKRELKKNVTMTFSVWRLSPAGIELVGDDATRFENEERVDVSLTIGAQNIKRHGYVTGTIKHGHRTLVGISFIRDKTRKESEDAQSIRKSLRWTCSELFAPTGSFSNPGRFQDTIIFRTVNISRRGMAIATSLRNKFVLIGMRLKGTMECPMAGTIHLEVEVISSRILQHKGSDRIHILGCKFLNLKRKYAKTLGNYIIRFGHNDKHLPSPYRLRREGYGHIDMSNVVDWDYVSSAEDYQKVLELRSKAFGGATNLAVSRDAAGMADIYDSRSRILMARFRNTVIGTVRFCFHEKGDTFEEENYVTFPSNFPPKEQIVEASRAATDPEFRGTSLFLNMLRFGMLTTLQGKRTWIVQSTYRDLVPVYKRIGFKETGVVWTHPDFPGDPLHQLIVNAETIGALNIFIYQSFVSHIEAFLRTDAFNNLSWIKRQQIQLYRYSKPIFNAAMTLQKIQISMKRRFKKRKDLPS